MTKLWFFSIISSWYAGLICCKGPMALGSRLARSSENSYSELGGAVLYASVYTGREVNGAMPWSSGNGV